VYSLKIRVIKCVIKVISKRKIKARSYLHTAKINKHIIFVFYYEVKIYPICD